MLFVEAARMVPGFARTRQELAVPEPGDWVAHMANLQIEAHAGEQQLLRVSPSLRVELQR